MGRIVSDEALDAPFRAGRRPIARLADGEDAPPASCEAAAGFDGAYRIL